MNHDIIVIGASAGGLEALERMLPGLPADLPAAVFVVMHVGSSSHLARVLAKHCRLPISEAVSGADIVLGRIRVAPPGYHLLVHDKHILLRRGPRENMARPAVDPLFRSAAATFSSRVIGVILSGALNDGAAGLRSIQRCGGVTVVQDPIDAAVPGMPRTAVRHVRVDHVVTAEKMGPLLGELARRPAGPSPRSIPIDIRVEAAIAAQEIEGMGETPDLGEPSQFVCPECQGPLWELNDGGILRYRCMVGHAYTADVVLAAQAEEAERLLWSLLRAHRERAALVRRMAEQERASDRATLAEQLENRAHEYDKAADLVRRIVTSSDDDGDAGTEDNQLLRTVESVPRSRRRG